MINKESFIVNEILNSIQNSILTEDQIISELSNNHNLVNSHLAKLFLDAGIISISDLSRIVANEDVIKHLLADEDWFGNSSYYGRELKNLSSTNTNEVFFWGTEYCGKSTLIGMLLSCLNSQYTIKPHTECQGYEMLVRYSNMYVENRISHFCAGNTSTSFEEMTFDLDKNKESVTFTFIETPGLFSRTVYRNYTHQQLTDDESVMIDNLLSICSQSYKRRIHIFCLPNDDIEIGWDGLPRSAYMIPHLQFLISNKILSRNDFVLLVSTKEDIVIPINDYAQNLETKYTMFCNSIREKSKEILFDMKILPFSIGQVYFQDICVPNFAFTQSIADNIIKESKFSNTSILNQFLRYFKHS